MDTKKRIIVVLGMHRSGTSAISRGLQVFGVDLGNNLMQPIPGNNEKGFWEDNDIYAFNESLLNKLDTIWHGVKHIDESKLLDVSLHEDMEQAIQILHEKTTNVPIFGFKDPRTAILLPFWQKVFNELKLEDSYIITLRNPISVTKSLEIRDGLEIEKALLLWEKHTVCAITYTNDKSRLVVDYDLLLDSPLAQLERIAKELNLVIPNKQGNEIKEYIDSFLTKQLRHTLADLSQLKNNTVVPEFVYKTYSLLENVAKDEKCLTDSSFARSWKSILKTYNEFSPVYSYIDHLDIERLNYRNEANLIKNALDDITSKQHLLINEKDAAIEDLQAVKLKLKSTIYERKTFEVERDAAVDELQKIKSNAETISNQNKSITAERDALVNEIGDILNEKDKVSTKLLELQEITKSNEDELHKIKNSNSYRLTAPLRSVRRLLVSYPYLLLCRSISKTIRAIWHINPLSVETKLRVKDYIFKSFPTIFQHTEAYRAWKTFNYVYTERDFIYDVEVESSTTLEKNAKYLMRDDHIEPEQLLTSEPINNSPVKIIAFYLPQFHPIPENDEWWGEGFTEWTNVKPAVPKYIGHYQPHVPGELGYYDLRDLDVQRRQVELAKLYGVTGFCFYFYWFAGKRLLETPVLQYLENKDLDLPYCICWANENWSRRWDGLQNEILIGQKHSPEDDLAFIEYVSKYLKDPRYIRIDGKPLLIVYRPSLLPSPNKTAARWRKWCIENDIGEIYLAYTQSFESVKPHKYGFDAAIEFPPNNSHPPIITEYIKDIEPNYSGVIYDYGIFEERSKNYQTPEYTLFRSVCPSWDNTARRKNNAAIFHGSTPLKYKNWLQNAINDTMKRFSEPSQRLIFVNAWNEWAEGAHLEPDQKYGYAYLQATRDAIENVNANLARRRIVLVAHDAHPHGAQYLILHMAKMLHMEMGFEIDMVVLGDGRLLDEYKKYAKVHLLSVNNNFGDEAETLADSFSASGVKSAITNTVVTGHFAAILQKHGFHVISLVHELPELIKKNGLEAHVKAISEHSDYVIFPAKQVKEGFETFAEVQHGKVIIRPQGLFRRNDYREPEQIIYAHVALRKKLNLSSSTKIILGIGYADYRKGIDLFVEIGQKILQKRDDVYFIWIGHFDVNLESEIKRNIAALGYSEHFIFPGLDFNTDIYYAGADIYALTSREDPFPSVVLEALDVGLPVIAFDEAGGYTELLNRDAGILVTQFDTELYAKAILELLENPQESKILSENGKNIITDEFSFRRYMFDMLNYVKAPIKRVSVIVPNYNYAQYLVDRINSIVRQDYPIYELIILDDASTDSSIDVINNIIHSLKIDCRFIVNDTNAGNPFVQWLNGVKIAKGDYVWIAEADDLADETFLTETLFPFDDPTVVMSYCQSKQMGQDGEILSDNYLDFVADVKGRDWHDYYIHEGIEEIRDCLAIKNTIPNVSGVIFNRTKLLNVLEKNINEIESYRVAGDWLTYIYLLIDGKIAFSPKSLNLHRRHQSSVTISSFDESQLEEILSVQQKVQNEYLPNHQVLMRAREYSDYLFKVFGLASINAPILEKHPKFSSYFAQEK